LAEQQHWLYAAVTGKDEPSDLTASTIRGGKLTPQQRVQIYRHAYLQRLIECLRDDFPIAEAALGVEVFEGYSREYIVRHPPESVSLNAYGERFPSFLRQMGKERSGGAVALWVAELAVLEWATVRAIHADASQTLSLAELSQVPSELWGGLRLRLSPSAQSFEFEHAINDYLTAAKQPAARSSRLAPPAAHTSWVLVCRRGEDVWRVELAAWAYRLLELLEGGSTLSDALAEVADSDSHLDVGVVMRCFHDWIVCGVFEAHTVSPS
jgi:hypothetical protein